MTIIPHVKSLSFFSPYIFVLIIHRFSEIVSRMFILASFGYFMNSGIYILYTLGFELIISTFIIMLRIYNFEGCFKFSKEISLFFYTLLQNILFLPVYWRTFITGMPGETDLEVKMYNFHWKFKALQHIVMTALICFKIFYYNNKYNDLAYIIFYISHIAFVLKYITLHFIFKWIPKKLNYNIKKENKNKFKSIINLCCKGN